MRGDAHDTRGMRGNFSDESGRTARVRGVARPLSLWNVQGRNREDPEQAFAARGGEIESWRSCEGAAKGLAHRAAARPVAMDRRLAARTVMGAMRHRLMDRGRFVRGGRTRALREKTQALQEERQRRQENDEPFSALYSPYPREISHKHPFFA
jgi:hypothetical protein